MSFGRYIGRARKLRRRFLTMTYRNATRHGRALPNFIVIGAQKGGTTSLFHYLSQHPQLVKGVVKEVHYFDGGLNPDVDNYERGEEWYRAHFPRRRRLKGGRMTFEATPEYILNPFAAKRMFELLPDVKTIALLRNPTKRAISHYLHTSRFGNEPLSLEQALRKEEERLEPVLQQNDYKNRTFRWYSYKYRGVYWRQLLAYREYFPTEQLLVLCSEDLFREPRTVLGRIFEFLGVDRRFQVRNLEPRAVSTNKTEIPQEVYEYLDEYFVPHNQALYELIGTDYGW